MRVWVAVGIFLGVFIIAFVIFVLRTGEGATASAPAAPSVAPITEITVDDSYSEKSGEHLIEGKATVPTACTHLLATSTVEGSAIRVNLSAPLDIGVCLALPTRLSYSVTALAPESASVAVYANGELATTTP